jgi:hypothetical protein
MNVGGETPVVVLKDSQVIPSRNIHAIRSSGYAIRTLRHQLSCSNVLADSAENPHRQPTRELKQRRLKLAWDIVQVVKHQKEVTNIQFPHNKNGVF